jgi:hypothetical protein
MKPQKPSLFCAPDRAAPRVRLLAATLIAIAVCAVNAPAVQMDVSVNGTNYGTVTVTNSGGASQGLQGNFTANTTLARMEAALGQDHLNWLQIVTADNMPPLGAGSNVLTAPYLDPPVGGYIDQWADQRPWYFDEVSPPATNTVAWTNAYLLANNVTATQLNYFDFPGGGTGTVVNFVTFLVSDYGNMTYSVLSGFTWSVSVNAMTNTVITSLAGGAVFSNSYSALVQNQTGWVLVPEPSALLLALIGLVTAIGIYRNRTRG